MFCNHQIAKLNTPNIFCFSDRKINYLRNLIPLMYLIDLSKAQFDSGFKRNKEKCNFHYVAMPMMTSQILKSVDFTKIQIHRYLKNETLFFL